mgnify:CR=1 FL=1
MDFNLTDDQRMLDETLRRYLAQSCDISRRNAEAYGPEGMSPARWAELAELGVIGALLTEAEGGFAGTGFDIALVFEALGRALVPEPFRGALLTAKALAAVGPGQEGALAPMLAGLLDGSVIGAFAGEEADSQFDPLWIATRARAEGAGYVLTGVKVAVEAAEAAGLFIVTARLSGAPGEAGGLALFAVPADTPGLSVTGHGRVDGGRAGVLTLHGAALPEAALIAEGAAAFDLIGTLGDYADLALAAEALGVMSVMQEATLDYIKLRRQFGRPIGSFQDLQHRMADIMVLLAQARSAVINAATLPADRAARAKAMAAARFTLAESGRRVAEEAIQMHGGIGMTWDVPLSHYMKRLTMIGQSHGDEDHHLARYIALSRAA